MNCPICGEAAIKLVKGLNGDRQCVNKHIWHYCLEEGGKKLLYSHNECEVNKEWTAKKRKR